MVSGQKTVFCWVPVPLLTMVINSVAFHPQLRDNGHPVDGVLVGAGSIWLHFT
jgi:hypothetical protein